MSDQERISIYAIPLARLAEIDGHVLLTFLSMYAPRVRQTVCDKWLSTYN
jgi:hypothetical protein